MSVGKDQTRRGWESGVVIRWGDGVFCCYVGMDRKHVLDEVISEWSPKETEGCGYLGEQHSRQGERQVQRPCGRSILGELEEQHRIEAGAGRGRGGGAGLVRQVVQAVVKVLTCSLSVIRSLSREFVRDMIILSACMEERKGQARRRGQLGGCGVLR